ncbi:MAG: biopolymer transporter ExbD [Verrucomicrobiales bacterium]|nr:biopolymer transporter ExbD [Verrucomicrobiales bacterium]
MIRRKAKNHSSRDENSDPGLDISSLIDVSFLLLIYFLITSAIDPREGDLGLTMPGKSLKAPVANTDFIDYPKIFVDAGGVVSMEGEVLDSNPDHRDLILLEDRLQIFADAFAVLDSNGDPQVELEVDDSVSGQRFIDVMNCLAGVGINKVKLVDFRNE